MSQFKVALIDKTLEQIPDWVPGELAAAGIDFVYSNCQTADDLLSLASDVDMLWIYGGNQLANAENLPKLSNCIAVVRSGSGVDRIDVDKANELGMVVVNTPHAHHDAVSDHAIALMFAVGRKMVVQDKYSRENWQRRDDFLPLWRLRQKTIGLIGFGLIPQFLVQKLVGFEPQFLVYDPFASDALLESTGVKRVDLDTLFSQSDIVSVHTPLTAETHHLIGEKELRQMKSDAILINTARGPVIKEEALARALGEKWIAGAGLDVFEVEPTNASNPLMGLDNIVVTPHTAGFSDESIDLTWRLSVEACIDLSQGYYPRSYVNRAVKPKKALQQKIR